MDMAEQLQIDVELAPRLARFAAPDSEDHKFLLDSLTRFSEQFTGSLALPVKPSLHIGLAASEADAHDFRAKINGQQCRLPLPTKVSEQVTAREMARLLMASIYQNRDLWLTPALSAKILDEWLPRAHESTAPAEISGEEFHRLLLELIRRNFRIERSKSAIAMPSSTRSPENILEDSISGANALTLYLSREQAAIPSFNTNSDARPGPDGESIVDLIRLMQEGLFYELGLVLPNMSVEIDDSLQADEFQLQINDLRLPPFSGLTPDQTLVNDTAERLALLNLKAEKAINPANGIECALVRGTEAADLCRQSGLTTWGTAGFVILKLSREIRNNAGALLTQELVEFMADQLSNVYPALKNAIQTRFNTVKLAAILRGLLDEEISVRDLRGILEGLLAINGTTTEDLSKHIVFLPYTLNLCQLVTGAQSSTPSAEDYSNYVRTFMKKYISHKYTRGNSTLPVYLIDPEIEARLNRMEVQPLNNEERDKLIDSVLKEVQPSPTATPVILTSMEIRRLLRKLLEREFPWLAVLSYQELSPELNIQPLARISWY